MKLNPPPPLDPGFLPAVLFNRNYVAAAKKSGHATPLVIGLEREEHKQHDVGYAFGGVTTFPLIGLVSYALALIGKPDLVPIE